MSELASFPATFAAPQTRADLVAANPLLELFQFAQESDESKGVKVGPGYWNDLQYIGQSGIKFYRATLTQTGTAAPVVTAEVNTLGDDAVWTRNGVGQYIVTVNQRLTVDKTIARCHLNTAFNNDAHFMRIQQEDGSACSVLVKNLSFTDNAISFNNIDADGTFSVEILVIP